MTRRFGAAAVFLAAGLLSESFALAHEVIPPKPLQQAAPAWPAGESATHDVVVPVVLTVGVDGKVEDVQIEASLGQAFDDAAIAAARTWIFEPATSEGHAVTARIRSIVRFVGVPAAAVAPPPQDSSAAGERGSASSTPHAGAHEASPQDETSEHSAPAGGEAVPPGPPPVEVVVAGVELAPPRSASETTRGQDVIRAAPHRTGGDLLQIVPGVYITQHSGQGKAYQVFYRGFDAVHGQDLEFWVGGAPVNEVSNLHGQGYADLHFVMPEVVSEMRILPGTYDPQQGDFAVAGTIRYELGYSEPGLSAKGTVGSYGERRVFLGYHPEGYGPASFAAFEAQSTDGFGPSRAANRASVIAQHAFPVGPATLRLLATGYAGRFDSPGVVRLSDIESGRMGRFDTYGVSQGGFSSRYQLVAELSENGEGRSFSLAPYLVVRDLRLRQNYTGYLVNASEGDTTQQTNESVALGFTGSYRRHFHLFSPSDSIAAGVSLRNDWIDQSELDVGATDERVLDTVVNAKIRALDAGGWLDLTLRPVPRITLRGGVRVDALAYGIEDDTPVTDTRTGTSSSTFEAQLHSGGAGGLARAAMGTHVGPRATVDAKVWNDLHVVGSYGEGFRSPQARSLTDGEKTPFAKVRSVELGARYHTDGFRGSASVFRTTLSNDLVFDPETTRNESVPPSQRLGASFELVAKPLPWFLLSDSATWTRATFTGSDSTYSKGDKLPYVPEVIVRQDLAFTPALGSFFGRPLTGRFGTGLTGMFSRPQPYGGFGHDVFLVDATAELRLKEIAVDLDVMNVLDTHWYDSEFTYSANWTRGSTASLVPERYVTAGAPRTVLFTVALYLN